MNALYIPKRQTVHIPNLDALSQRNDALGSFVFARQLEAIDPEIYRYVFPELLAETILPTKTDLPVGAEYYVWRSYSPAGIAKIIAQYADDIPLVDTQGEENITKVRTMAAGWQTNIKEVAASQLPGGPPITAEKGINAKRAIGELLERLAVNGDSRFKMVGLANQPNATTITLPAGSGSGATTAWDAGKTDEEIVADLNALALRAVALTGGRAVPNTLAMSPGRYGYLSGRRLTYSDTTVVDFFLRSNPYIKNIIPWQPLATAGVGGTERIIAFRRDPMYLKLITGALQLLDPEPKNMTIKNNLWRDTAGVVAHQPLAIVYADGV